MERSLASLTYKGSIPEAILEAKMQKKLFVVYISGENSESAKLEESTWTDGTVAESLTKYCVLLHIQEGNTDAANFSAIYPYNSIPCITTIGFNGAQIWKHEGFIAADVFASTLEKAWLSLQIQETTVILSAALASQKSQPSTSSASSAVSPAEAISSDATVASPSTVAPVQSSEREPLVTTTKERDVGTNAGNALDNKADGQSASAAEGTEKLENVRGEASASHVDLKKDPVRSVTTESKNQSSRGADSLTSGMSVDQDLGMPGRKMNTITHKAKEDTQHQNDEGLHKRNNDTRDSSQTINQSSDVHLNIRLPDGVSLQEKFSVTSTLRMVKDYVDRNQTNAMGSYDLAIPYPRKLFNDQDLSKSLSDLGLFNRQALIVVPRQKGTSHRRGASSSTEQTISTTNSHSENGIDGGYFGYVRRALSYINPFSYFGGAASSSNSGPASHTSAWEYGPNPALRNNLAQADRTHRPSASGSSSDSSNDTRNRKPTTSRLGSNIHTLKHDEDDPRFGDRNAFWNGNSTQYGGGDNNGR